MSRPVRAIIDIATLRQNLRLAKHHAPKSRVMAVIKANGYGHGLLRVANALGDADGFAVADIDEGLALRQAGHRKPICLLTGFHDPADLNEVLHHDLTVVLHSMHQIDALESAGANQSLRVWVKIDTGMHRVGFALEELDEVLRRLSQLSLVPTCLMSHLANADDRDDPYTCDQLEKFQACCQSHPYPRSLANSAGIMAWKETHFDWVRPGIMLYGLTPLLGCDARELGLRQAMSFESRLIAVKPLQAGDPVGYGGDWVCPESMVVGVVACGYGDGYLRHAPSGTPLLVDQHPAPLVGRVSMDMLTVDLRNHPRPRVGDRVTLWGMSLPADEIAQRAGTIAYELVCGITPRVPRLEVNQS